MATYHPPNLGSASKAISEESVVNSPQVPLIRPEEIHQLDLFKLQNNIQAQAIGEVLVIVEFPKVVQPMQSCKGTSFQTGRLRMTKDQILGTGSPILRSKLTSTTYQARMSRQFEPLPAGVTRVLVLSPPIKEEEHAVALQQLTITDGIKLWFRASDAAQVSPALVGGHDDVCSCSGVPQEITEADHGRSLGSVETLFGHSHPVAGPRVCIFDQNALPKLRDICDYCQVRQAANTLRLLRALGEDSVLIDSAPRLWTLVGLFRMFEMTNYDILRDPVTVWMMTEPNTIFIEMLPEETLRIATVIKSPLIAEPAFRILASERALVVAGGELPPGSIYQTIFGRKSSDCLSGTEDGESVLRMVEHAGTRMAERFKIALDNLYRPEVLSLLGVGEWKKVIGIDSLISDGTHPLRGATTELKHQLVRIFHAAIDKIVSGDMPSGDSLLESSINTALKFYVPWEDVNSALDASKTYRKLNKYQRALTPFIWNRMSSEFVSVCNPSTSLDDAIEDFNIELQDAISRGVVNFDNVDKSRTHVLHGGESQFDRCRFFGEVETGLRAYAAPLLARDDGFTYTITPHLILGLSIDEMEFLRLEFDGRYESEVPDSLMGPSGPGPSFRTGQTVASETDSFSDGGIGNLAIGAATVAGSMAVQDGILTVFDRRGVVVLPESAPSEQFTDSDGFTEAHRFVASSSDNTAGQENKVNEATEQGEDVSLAFEYEDSDNDNDDNDNYNDNGDDDDEIYMEN